MFRVQSFKNMMLRGVPSSFGDVKTPYVGHLKYIISCKNTHKYDLIIDIPSKMHIFYNRVLARGNREKVLQGEETLQIRTNSHVKP